MKYAQLVIMFLTILVGPISHADCFTNQNGKVVCGKGQCESDQYGKVFCADAGGGAIKDTHGNVLCGVGLCEQDDTGHVWCSKTLGGGAARDSMGKVKCLGGCDAGSRELCQEAQ